MRTLCIFSIRLFIASQGKSPNVVPPTSGRRNLVYIVTGEVELNCDPERSVKYIASNDTGAASGHWVLLLIIFRETGISRFTAPSGF